MKLDVDALIAGYREMQKEAAPVEPGSLTPAPTASAPPSILGRASNFFSSLNPVPRLENDMSGAVNKAVGGLGNQLMGGVGKMMPLLAMGMMGSMGGSKPGMGGGIQPGQPIARIPQVAGMKYGSEKQAVLAGALFALQNKAVKDTITNLATPQTKKEVEPKKTTFTSKDEQIEKALANPSVNAYVHKLTDTNS